jgi:TetR/AcrR family transcriptional repressor of nem operon
MKMTKGELTRQKIVAEAAPIFNKHGYEGSSMAELMEATGLKKGGIYRHFSSKEELAGEAFDYTWQAAWNARMLHMDEHKSGIGRLKQLITNFVDNRPSVGGGCPILNTAVDADDGNPVLRAKVRDALRGWMARLETMVEEAAKQGELRRGVNAKKVATLIIANLEGALMISRLERNLDALENARQHLHHYIDTHVAKEA